MIPDWAKAQRGPLNRKQNIHLASLANFLLYIVYGQLFTVQLQQTSWNHLVFQLYRQTFHNRSAQAHRGYYRLCNSPISVKHFSVTLRNIGTFRNWNSWYKHRWLNFTTITTNAKYFGSQSSQQVGFKNVAKRNPVKEFQQCFKGSSHKCWIARIILGNSQAIFRKKRNLSEKDSLLTITNWHSWKTAWNSPQNCCFKCWDLAWVIWPAEKSKTSSLKHQWKRITIRKGKEQSRKSLNTLFTSTTVGLPYCSDKVTRWFDLNRRFQLWSLASS